MSGIEQGTPSLRAVGVGAGLAGYEPKVTAEQAEKVLRAVAEVLGKKHGMGVPSCSAGQPLSTRYFAMHSEDGTDCEHGLTFGPAPTGVEAARNAEGPMLNMTWDWPSSGPTPTVLLEGGPEEWAYEVCYAVQAACPEVFVEPYSTYALCIYPVGA